MRVTILGNNSALPAFGRHPSAQAVTIYGEILLIDCGEGTQVQMQRYGVKWRNLHHIFISHMHGDHYFGLPGLVNSMSLLGRVAPLHIYGPAPLKGVLDSILQAANTVLNYPLHFHELPQGRALLIDTPSFQVHNFQVDHGIECHGFFIETKTRGRHILPDSCKAHGVTPDWFPRLKHGEDFVSEDGTLVPNDVLTTDGPTPKKYAYCADTRFTDSYLDIIKGADAIYHEATYLHEDVEKAASRFHCTAVQAAQLAALAGVGMLLIGHFSSKYKDLEPFQEEASAIFPASVVSIEGVAYDL